MVKLIVTLGPSVRTEAGLRRLKAKGVDFVRINMSHSSVDDLRYFIALAKKIGIPFIVDTEGSQIRSGRLSGNSIMFSEDEEVRIHAADIVGDQQNISLRPSHIVSQLEPGDMLHIDFESLILRVADTSHAGDGFVLAKAMSAGRIGNNKAVIIDSAMPKAYDLPPLSEKDYQSIAIGLQEGVGYIAASFMRSGDFVDTVRDATKGRMKIISKIECVDGLKNLDEIIQKSDALLIDRGDLSKEIPIEKIPFAQKIIMSHAHQHGKPVFVATNLLETMVEKQRPTRAEAHDVIATILDGAAGVALSAETAIGKYPFECVSMMQKLVGEAVSLPSRREYQLAAVELANHLEKDGYLFSGDYGSVLVPPHGGSLVERILLKPPAQKFLETVPKILVDETRQMDAEQIAFGTFSPLEGFMGKKDCESVLETMRLANGTIWPLPIVLDVSEEAARKLIPGREVVLADKQGNAFAVLRVDEIYAFDKELFAKRLYGTLDESHPGVKQVMAMLPILVGGKIDLFRRRRAEFSDYALAPRQVRRLFAEKHWSRVVGFHTRNVIHRSHEYIQLKALEEENCDGLFVHPVVGKKKAGDYHAAYIIKSYQRMMNDIYPENKVVFATFNTYSRYAGPREALFTAICRQNFGCSHFVVGRDHTGVGNFYPADASHKIFDEFPDLKIKPIRFGEVFYSKKTGDHMHASESPEHDPSDKLSISGTEARKIFELGERPPEWFMRPEISEIIAEAVSGREEVFVKNENRKGTVIWFTGLSGSGKSTIAEKLKNELESRGKSVCVLDGDAIRSGQNKHLSFSREDIRENNRLIAELARERAGEHDFVLVPIISPYREDRAMARTIIGGGFLELYVNASLEKCIERDPKGLYKKALAGEISNFIGVAATNPYEAPTSPDIKIDNEKFGIEQNIERLLNYLIS
ncbi:MAG: sulfate adenylyltransferase [Candidatus Sungbacteria bacterium]|nr:sulfate adenylyltransferase [Candidatus Sungbacteria bacterium]